MAQLKIITDNREFYNTILQTKREVLKLNLNPEIVNMGFKMAEENCARTGGTKEQLKVEIHAAICHAIILNSEGDSQKEAEKYLALSEKNGIILDGQNFKMSLAKIGEKCPASKYFSSPKKVFNKEVTTFKSSIRPSERNNDDKWVQEFTINRRIELSPRRKQNLQKKNIGMKVSSIQRGAQTPINCAIEISLEHIESIKKVVKIEPDDEIKLKETVKKILGYVDGRKMGEINLNIIAAAAIVQASKIVSIKITENTLYNATEIPTKLLNKYSSNFILNTKSYNELITRTFSSSK